MIDAEKTWILERKFGRGDGIVDVPALMRRYPDAAEAIMLAYETGYVEGENSAKMDFHVDNPHAIKMAYELIGKVLEQ